MRVLRAILTATAICAVMLAAAIHLAGELPRSAPYAGLTAADVLGSDGTPPEDGVWSGADRGALGRPTIEASQHGGLRDGARG